MTLGPFVIGWPEAIWLTAAAIGVVMSLAALTIGHREPTIVLKGTWSLITTSMMAGLLWWGGFFS